MTFRVSLPSQEAVLNLEEACAATEMNIYRYMVIAVCDGLFKDLDDLR